MTTADLRSRPAPAPGRSVARSTPVVDLRRVLSIGIALLVALHGVMLALYYGFGVSSAWGLLEAIDLGRDAGVGTWWSSGVLGLAGVTAAAIGTWTDRAHRSSWTALALLLAALSVDEVAMFHDDISDPLNAIVGAGGALYYVWIIPGLAILAAFALWQRRFLTGLAPTLRRRLAVASAVYLVGAVGFEMLEALLWTRSGFTPGLLIHLQIGVEELFEMAGAALFLLALARHLAGADRLRLGVGHHSLQVVLAPAGRRDPLPSPPR